MMTPWQKYILDKKAEDAREQAEYEARQKANADRIAALRAKQAQLQNTLVALEKKLGITDWLCYLPRKAGGPEWMERAERYLEEMRTRLAAEGTTMFLDANHNATSRIFLISKFRAMDGCVFCTGEWTETGRRYRNTYRGISADNIVFAGDMALLDEKYTPPCLNLTRDAPAPVQAAANSTQSRGLAGAACLGMDPAYGVTPIYRFARDTITGRERLEHVRGVLNNSIVCGPFELPELTTTKKKQLYDV